MSDKFLIIGITRPELNIVDGEYADTDRILQLLSHDIIDYLHLRIPEATSSQLSDIIERIPEELHQRITLHDHFELISDFCIGGVHINGRTPDKWSDALFEKSDFHKRCNRLRISKSFHSLQELTANRLQLDYATLSPIYDSISKRGYKSHFPDTDELNDIVRRLPIPIVALGGVTPDKFIELKSLGFKGAAMLGALFE